MNAEWDPRIAWREYYRAVRVLRSLRRHDPVAFRRFSGAWWQGFYRFEVAPPAPHRPRPQRVLP